MDISWFMFFDKDGLPLAVFYTDCCDRATRLFSMLYKKEWEKCAEDGISIKKEADVPLSEWERIATELKRPCCAVELIKHKPIDTQVLIMDASMKVAREAYLKQRREKELKSKWAAI